MRTLIVSSALVAVALFASAPGALAAQDNNKAYCLQEKSGAKNCIYDSMAQCEAAKKGQGSSNCTPRANENTGSGGHMTPAPK